MKQFILIVLGCVLLAGGVSFAIADTPPMTATLLEPAAEGPAVAPAEAQKAPGYVLLDGLANLFMVKVTKEGDMDGRLDELMRQARTAYEQKQIPLPFFTRYHRLLGLFRLVTLNDPERVVYPTMQVLVDEFVREVIGPDPAAGGKLPHVAVAIEEEIVSLQIYLDTLKSRQALLEGMKGKLPPPPPPKPAK